jgi:hypothetical protein
MRKAKKSMMGFLAVMAFSWSMAASAQQPPPLAEMWLIVPKPEHQEEFYKALAEHMAFRKEQGDPRNWQVYVPTLGPNLNRIGIRYCCINWADVDAYEQWSDENDAVGKHFNENVAPHIEKGEHYFETISWENSHWSDAKGPFKLFAVTEFNVKGGQAAAFARARDTMSQIALNQGWASDSNVWLWTSTIGGPPQQGIVIPHPNWADMDRNEEDFFSFLTRVMGSSEAATSLMNEFSSTVESTNFEVWRHSDKLSMKDED